MKLNEYLSQSVIWSRSDNPEYPYYASYDGKELRIRLNDFPSEYLYTLIAEKKEVSFDEWPATWNRTNETRNAGVTTVRIFSRGYPKPTSRLVDTPNAIPRNGGTTAGRPMKSKGATAIKITGKPRNTP